MPRFLNRAWRPRPAPLVCPCPERSRASGAMRWDRTAPCRGCPPARRDVRRNWRPVASPYDEGIAFVMTRGEEDAPRVGAAFLRRRKPRRSRCGANSFGASGGGVCRGRSQSPPPGASSGLDRLLSMRRTWRWPVQTADAPSSPLFASKASPSMQGEAKQAALRCAGLEAHFCFCVSKLQSRQGCNHAGPDHSRRRRGDAAGRGAVRCRHQGRDHRGGCGARDARRRAMRPASSTRRARSSCPAASIRTCTCRIRS